MNFTGLRKTLDTLAASRGTVAKPLRLALAASLDSPVGVSRALLESLRESRRYEPHLVGPEEAIQPLEPYATLHPAYLPEEIDAVLGNLLTSGGFDLCLLLPDPRRPEPSARQRLRRAFRTAELTGISLLQPETVGRPLLLADTLTLDQPDHDGMSRIIERTVATARKLGIEVPRVALLAAVEVAAPGIPVTLLEQEVAARFEGRADCHVQGPLSVDLAVNPQAAEKKKAKGEVPGRADILVAPNLTVARGVLHALLHGCGEPALTALCGGSLQVAVAERGLSAEGFALTVEFAAAIR